MRRLVWGVLVGLCRLIPARARQRLCGVLFAAGSRRRPAKAALTELVEEHDVLRFQIDECAVRYEGGLHPKHRLMDYHRFFVDRLSVGERVLDIGCGCGAVAASMAESGALVTGIDLDPENISMARRTFQHDSLTFLVGDATQSLPQDTFDTVVLSNVLEHLENRVALLKGVQEQVRPERWLIRVPMINRDWLVYLKRELNIPYFSDPTHHVEYTRESFEHEMRQAHLAIEDVEFRWGEIWAELRSAES